MASSAGKASWIAAASVGAVEALKDQAGMCRWNHVLRSLHQHAKTSMGSSSLAKRRPTSSSSSSSSAIDRLRQGRSNSQEKAKESEESLRTVMYLSTWGPN